MSLLGPESGRFVRALAGVGVLVAGMVGGTFALDSAGSWYLRHRDRSRLEAISEAKAKVATYRRPIVFGRHLNQNAALWYEQAFAQTEEPPVRVLRHLQSTVSAGYHNLQPTDVTQFQRHCSESVGPLVGDAMRCVRCDWRLGYDFSESATFPAAGRALALANCLTLEGHKRARGRDWRGAADFYLRTVAFGCDLSMGNLVMNVIAIAAAQAGAESLGQLLSDLDHEPGLKTSLQKQLGILQDNLPDARSALRFDRLQLTSGLATEVRTFATEQRNGLRRFVPWQALAAWHLSTDSAILEVLAKAEEARNRRERVQLAQEIRRRAALGWSRVLKNEISDHWVGVSASADDLSTMYAAVRVGFGLEDAFSGSGAYPLNLGEMAALPAAHRLRYERADDGQSYRLLGLRGAEDGAVLLQRTRAKRP
jgi:hypothetical protein